MAIKTKNDSKTDKESDEKMVTSAPVRDMTVFSFRVDRKLKEKADKVYSDLGISMSAALNMFLSQCVFEQGLPFRPSAHGKSREMKDDKNRNIDDIDYMTLEELCGDL